MSTTSKGFEKDTSSKKWITEEQFNELFPRGYRECNFFSSPVEFWSMSKEECFAWKQTALLDLNSKINLQKNLQQTFIIGHSSDSKLLTELLNLNSQNSKVESLNTSINNNVNSITEVLRKKISNNKKCYTCNNICKCSRLIANRLKNSLRKDTIPLLSKAQFVLPEIQLIDEIKKSTIKLLLHKNMLKVSKDVNVTKIANPSTSENYDNIQNESNNDLENIFYDNNVLTLLEETTNTIESRPTTPLDNRIIVTESTSIQTIQDESIDENNENKENVLKYFHLNSVSDMFQDLQDDDDVYVMDTEFDEMVYS